MAKAMNSSIGAVFKAKVPEKPRQCWSFVYFTSIVPFIFGCKPQI